MNNYLSGRIPTVESLQGVWRVKMWGWWRFMRLDRKVIAGSRGYNVFLGLRWGAFSVKDMHDSISLVYDNGRIIDYLRIRENRIIGSFTKNGKYKAMFMLEKIA